MAETAKLSAAEWTRRDDLLALVAALDPDGHALRYVGGAVRDTVLGAEVHDIDCATTLEPVEVMARLEAAGVRTVPTGLKHGTVTAILASGNVEITTLRSDVTTDGRHAEVAFSSDWKEDAARRDFTINALYADPRSLEIFDYFGGLDDLAAGRVRFIGDASQRIREDHLRILRYFRFQARFGDGPDEEAEAACAALARLLSDLSAERVGWELQTLLALPDPVATVRRMDHLGVLPVVLPEADPDGLARLVAAEAAARVAPDAIRRLAALLPSDPDVAEKVGERLRLSNSQRKRLVTSAQRQPDDGEHPRRIAYRFGVESALDRLLLTGADPAPVVGWEVPVLPLKGGDIVAREVAPGPEVSRILAAVEERWIAEGFPDEKRAREILETLL